MAASNDPLDDFDRTTATYGDITRAVYKLGTGPGVIVMSEIPGITPKVADFARRVSDIGCTVAMPRLFGTPGRAPSVGYTLRSLASACVSKEFVTLARGRTSPVTGWLRQYARDLHRECGGPGVGAIGMCFTGGFALAMMVDPVVVAPVLSQPSLPFPVTRKNRRDLGISAADRAAVVVRGDACPVLGLRFSGDVMAPADRFETLAHELGDRFIGVTIDSSKGNAHGLKRSAHSVVTEHLVDEPGHPTRDALDQVLDFFRSRLLAPSGVGEPG